MSSNPEIAWYLGAMANQQLQRWQPCGDVFNPVEGNVTPAADLDSEQNFVASVFLLQRRDEVHHAPLFDRIAPEVHGLPRATAPERRAAARAHVRAAVLELFEERLPALASELAAGRTGLGEGVSRYHMVLEGIVFDAGQQARRLSVAGLIEARAAA